MPIETTINEPTQAIRAAYTRWAKNRAFVDGEEAVKAQGATYLPAANPDDSPAEYRAYLDRTGFLPAASKIAQGLSGLIFRKRAQLNTTSARVETLTQLITPDGQALDDLAEWVVRETMITNFTGLLVDHPERDNFTDLSAANEIERGYRPRIAGYAGETILEVTPGLVNNMRTIVRVRLLEDDGATVRELMLNEGKYQLRCWTRSEGGFVPGAVKTPLRNGQPLTEIPFVLVSTSDKLTPCPSILQHSVDLNLQHYRVEGLLTSVLYFLSAPIPVVVGLKPSKDDKGNDIPINLQVAVGNAWVFPEPDTKAEYLEFKGSGASVIENKLKNIKDELSTIGHSILAPEKPAPEAAETQMLRRAAENATLAGFTRTISRKLERAMRMFAWWADRVETDLTYSLNTDFLPQQMSPQEMTALMGMWQAGAITHETLLYALRDGEIVSPALDVEAEVERTKMETADRPAVI